MKISILSRYDRLGASSRLRTMQYLTALQMSGCQTDISAFFTDEYLVRLYSGRGTARFVMDGYLRRLRQLWSVRGSDLIWIEKEALPWLPWVAERALLPRGVPLVIDYDDAVFHRYDMHRLGVVRNIMGRKLDYLMAASDLVTAGNPYLANRALSAGAKRVEIVPTVVDISHYAVRSETPSNPIRIGWIGTPSTWNEYMVPMLPFLTELAATHGARIVAVGAAKTDHPLIDVLPWSEASEVEMIQSMDIGLMPLTDTPWSRGKCGYKLIQYMACGVPVIAAPVSVNADIVEQGVNGFLVRSQQEWRDAVKTFLDDANLRRRFGLAGRKKVELHYSLQVWGPKLAALLRETAGRRRK